MIGFEESSLSNVTMSQIVRGSKTKYGEQLNGVSFYLPPTVKLYTIFSLQEYFIIFCGLLVLQSATIFALDQWWLKCLPKIVSSGETMGTICNKKANELNLPENLEIIAGTTDSNAGVLAAYPKKDDGITILGSTIVIKKFVDKPTLIEP